jgi:hypothetical protein
MSIEENKRDTREKQDLEKSLFLFLYSYIIYSFASAVQRLQVRRS